MTDSTGMRSKSGPDGAADDPHRTRTANTAIRAAGDEPSSSGGDGWVDQKQVLPEEMDEAAISFARQREATLARLDHSASVKRLRRALTIGLPVWILTILVDLFVTQYAGEGDLRVFLCCRLVGAVLVILVLWRLGREPEPSVGLLRFYDILVFTAVAAIISVSSLVYRGVDGPYAPSVSLVLLARGATTLAPWQTGAWLFAGPALAYPVVILVAAQVNVQVAAQLADPRVQGSFVTITFQILISWAMLVLGGHFAWRLRREAVETRNIGRYKLLRRLGSGGGGDVWAAFDTVLRHRVALKTVSGQSTGSQLFTRLEREVRALSELTHPNTVRVFDYGVTDDHHWYYTMELLHGENLRQLITREGPLTVERLCRIARQVLRALGEAHDKGIIHRDIKPENVFIAQVGGDVDVVKLLDFGVARTSYDTQLTKTGFVTGTPAYMAPETLFGHRADVRSDIYAFGATVYFALTGRLPFQDEDPTALFAAHVSRPLQRMSAVAVGPIPPALDHIVERCMAKDPAVRYASTYAVLEAFNPLGPARFVLGETGLPSTGQQPA